MNELNILDYYAMLHNDVWTFYLTFCGILISMLTLLYSFIANKRSELEIYAEQSKESLSDPIVHKRKQLAINSIKKMRTMSKWIFITLCLSFGTGLLSWIVSRFLPQTCYFDVLIIVGVLSFLVLGLSIWQLIKVIKLYKQDTII